MNIAILIVWLIAGISVIITGNVTMLIYVLCWLNLMIYLVRNVMEGR